MASDYETAKSAHEWGVQCRSGRPKLNELEKQRIEEIVCEASARYMALAEVVIYDEHGIDDVVQTLDGPVVVRSKRWEPTRSEEVDCLEGWARMKLIFAATGPTLALVALFASFMSGYSGQQHWAGAGLMMALSLLLVIITAGVAVFVWRDDGL